MFCPQCGQQQPSEDVRFCPKCGLSLLPHASLLAGHDSAAAAARAPRPPQESDAPSARRAAMRRGAKLIFFSVVLFPIFFGFCFLVDGPGPLFVPLTLFLTGLVWLVYARLFGEELIHVNSRKDLGPGAGHPALDAPRFTPAPLFNQQRANTAEIYQPPSVTENTTRLLDKDS